jgi:hypothetical protein
MGDFILSLFSSVLGDSVAIFAKACFGLPSLKQAAKNYATTQCLRLPKFVLRP